MALNPVTLAETLRPWHVAGITCLLADPELAAQVPEVTDAAERPGGAATMPQPPGRSVGSPGSAPPAVGPGALIVPLASPEPGVSEPDSKDAVAPPVHSGALPEDEQVILPSAWQSLLEKTGRAALVWTYAELGEDLQGRGDTRRSACLRALIGRLSLPRGSNAFWPVSLPSDGEDAPVGVFFRAGLRRLAPRVLIFLGQEAVGRSGLPLSLCSPYRQTIYRGMLCVLTPGFEELLASESHRVKSAVFLSSALRGFVPHITS